MNSARSWVWALWIADVGLVGVLISAMVVMDMNGEYWVLSRRASLATNVLLSAIGCAVNIMLIWRDPRHRYIAAMVGAIFLFFALPAVL